MRQHFKVSGPAKEYVLVVKAQTLGEMDPRLVPVLLEQATNFSPAP